MPQEVFNVWRSALEVVLGNPEMQVNLRNRMLYADLKVDRDKITLYIQDLYNTLSQIALKEGIRLK
jgi:hypothetical protein